MNNGPKISLKLVCNDCQFHTSEYYCDDNENGDSGWDHSCNKIGKYIGSSYNTPMWCPLLPDSLRFEKLSNGRYTQVCSD